VKPRKERSFQICPLRDGSSIFKEDFILSLDQISTVDSRHGCNETSDKDLEEAKWIMERIVNTPPKPHKPKQDGKPKKTGKHRK
jgi:hypothetical protein